MAVGMGAVFVPLTLTAVHHLRAEDSGIGSGVLNTMQQVGGALGLAILSTVALHFADGSKTDLTRGLMAQGVPAEDAGALAFLGSFTEGATAAFLVGAVLVAIGSAAVWLFLNVKHEEARHRRPRGRCARGLTRPCAPRTTARPVTPGGPSRISARPVHGKGVAADPPESYAVPRTKRNRFVSCLDTHPGGADDPARPGRPPASRPGRPRAWRSSRPPWSSWPTWATTG